ncbi:kinase-like protein [Backusella circina FSU 941]|nr:kinase-like protein [Backusella circina FSU 941]
MNAIFDINVSESPIYVKDSGDDSWKTVPEFNITVKTDQYTVYVIRYIPDLYSFDHLIKAHYHKIKIPFPTLTESLSKAEKRRSIRNFFHMSAKHKSNADKVEKYLYRCSMDPILKKSSLLRDFFSPQRDGDFQSTSERTDCSSRASSISHENTGSLSADAKSLSVNSNDDDGNNDNAESIDSNPDVAKMWVPNPMHSVVSFSTRNSQPEEMEHDDDIDIIDSESNPISDFPLDHLEMIKVLGKGCMGKVLLVKSKATKELYALKSIIKDHVIDQREISHTLAERNILALLSEIDHPFLAKLYASFQDEHRLYLLTNYYCGGDLATHMARLYTFSKDCALFYAAEIIEGIGELHRMGALYRDLKPENILLTASGHIILTDFGLSKFLIESEDYSTQTFCGTAEYLAPEVLLGESYSFGIDYWSFGTILYEMLAGITPFWADNHADMYRRVLEDPLEFPADIFDYETAEFLSDILDRDPRTRLGVNGVDEIKSHVYFADISWEDLRARRIQPPFIPPVADELDFANFDPDFLAMEPELTPVPSEIDFSPEIQDIFDGYSFTDEQYIAEEKYFRNMHPDAVSEVLGDEESELDQVTPLRQEEEEEEEEEGLTVFQPARKRGSVSMLSDVDSFCVGVPTAEHTIHDIPSIQQTFKDEEHARYAKRRNTSASEDHHVTQEEYTLAVPNQHSNIIPDLSAEGSTVGDATSFDDLEFSKSPDLRLSFNIDRAVPSTSQNPSNKSVKTNNSRQSKARRFFSLLL